MLEQEGRGLGPALRSSGTRGHSPGALPPLNGLYDAQLDHQPIVAIVGDQPRTVICASYMQEVDLTSLFKDGANEYVQLAAHPAQMRHLIDRAVRIAIAQPHGHLR